MSAVAWLLSCCFRARDSDDVDERTALLDSDLLPQPPPQPDTAKRTTEEERAEQEALKAILNDATERLVSIGSPRPFPRSQTGTHAGVTRLGVSKATPFHWRRAEALNDGSDSRPPSTHSLHTLLRQPIPRSSMLAAAREASIAQESESNFGTMRSYRTAIDQGEGSDDDQGQTDAGAAESSVVADEGGAEPVEKASDDEQSECHIEAGPLVVEQR